MKEEMIDRFAQLIELLSSEVRVYSENTLPEIYDIFEGSYFTVADVEKIIDSLKFEDI